MSTATAALGAPPAPQQTGTALGDFGLLWRRVFSDRPERSLRLRVLALAAALWSALSLVLVGVEPLIPFLCAVGFTTGHAVSHRFRCGRLPLLSLAVAVFIVALGIVMLFDLVAAIRGDRVPVAYFLLGTGAASSFELRTRGGLYTQLVFSGIVMFFASELAFGLPFALLLAGYALILLAFLATGHIADQSEEAGVATFENPARQTRFWATVGVGLLAASVVAFVLLPWDRDQVPHGARLSVLPFGGSEEGTGSGITPEMARELLKEGAAGTAAAAAPGASDGSGWLAREGGGRPAGAGIADGDLVDSGALPDLSRPLEAGGAGVVAYVRSPVASYWRGRVYDTYRAPEDGGEESWFASRAEEWGLRSVLVAPPKMGEDEQRYLQTFFVERELGNEVLTGYDPLAVAVERDGYSPVVRSGSVYQVLSIQPRTSSSSLRADRVEWQGGEYAALPESWGSLHTLTARVVKDAKTDFDKAAAIASYLHRLEYAADAEDPLEPRAPMRELLLGETPGSALDFATAMVLMARSAGLPARLATGYLPGDYSAYSGAATISHRDAHAWAEIAFRDAGWVPFDAAPRPDLPTAASVKKAPPGGLSYLLDHRFGDSLAEAISRAPGRLRGGIQTLLENGLRAALILVALGAVLTVAWLVYSRACVARPEPRFAYSTLPGKPRAEMIRAFGRLESMVSRRGFRRRHPNEAFQDYVSAASASLGQPAGDLGWFADAASRAAYSQAPFSGDAPRTARARLRHLRATL